MKSAIAFGIVLALLGCRPKPFEVKIVDANPTKRIEKAEIVSSETFDQAKKKKLSEAYKKAHSPEFGIIDGYYNLPRARPFGEAHVVRGFSYDTYVESVHIKGEKKPFAITSLSGDDAIAMSNAINSLLDLGVKIKEISMSDALVVAQEEERIYKDAKKNKLGTSLPPSVDFLLSINRASSEQGEMLIGRVIAKDGRLLAFRVLRNASTTWGLGALIISLFEDSIDRVANA